jgi:hypothetical protein
MDLDKVHVDFAVFQLFPVGAFIADRDASSCPASETSVRSKPGKCP